MRNHRIFVIAQIVLWMLCTSKAHSWHAEAGLESLDVTLSGPGLDYLFDNYPGKSGMVLRSGSANGDSGSHINWHRDALWISDTNAMYLHNGGATSFMGIVRSTLEPHGNSITFSHGLVGAWATGTNEYAHAYLLTSFSLMVDGTPPVGSNVTVTPTFGNMFFVEEIPPFAEAHLDVSITAYTYDIFGQVKIDRTTDSIDSENDPLNLPAFTFDLEGFAFQRIEFKIAIDATASVPEPGSLVLMTIGRLVMTRRRRMK